MIISKKLLSGVFLLMAILGVAYPSHAIACDCDDITTYADADLSFIGTVDTIYENRTDGPGMFTVEFTDIQILHSRYDTITNNLEKLHISIPCLNVACCGIELSKGDRLKMAADLSQGYFYSNDCFAYQRLNKALKNVNVIKQFDTFTVFELVVDLDTSGPFLTTQFCDFKLLFDSTGFARPKLRRFFANPSQRRLTIKAFGNELLLTTDLWSVPYTITQITDSSISFESKWRTKARFISNGNCESGTFTLTIDSDGTAVLVFDREMPNYPPWPVFQGRILNSSD